MTTVTTLGVLAVDGRPVRGERLAALVRELIEARGRAVHPAALVEAVWQGDPPDGSAGALQALVSRVRRLGLPVEAVPGGYRVPADRVDVDAVAVRESIERARAALRRGDAAAARSAADAARARFPETPDLAAGARLFADVAALRAEAALAGAGAFDEDDLRRLVAHPPPDEPAAALLVRVLAAQGRDAEALEVVERLRAELADRYGADPSPVLAEAHLALLRGELRAAPAPRPAAAALPPGWRRPAAPLVGREHDVSAVAAALAGAPLVTVVAPGGAGKTRLAAEVARRATGPVRVNVLAGVRAPDGVLPTVVAAFGGADTAPTAPGVSLERRVLGPRERLREIAAELDGLVVLDNCEHVLDAAADVIADLLAAAAPEVAVLATSRAPLGLAGEVVHRLAALPDAEALGLLQSRARAGGAVPTWDERRALALCHRLDNLPLALELAAARLRSMPIDDVLAGLSDRFALLDDALRGLPERHASLWAMVDWSRRLLAPGDRELLQRLAVIPAPFTADLAAAVAGEPDVRRGLANLVEQSLLSLEGDGGAPRYRMLETVREYGEARLNAAGDREAASAGLVGWARQEAIGLARRYFGDDQLSAFARCAAEQENLVAGLRLTVAADDEVAGIDIAIALFHLWSVRGLHLEVTGWAAGLLHADDPGARLRSAITAGAAAGRPLPDADRLAWFCLMVGVNAGITGPLRVAALAGRALDRLLTERPGEVSARLKALACAVPAFDRLRMDTDGGGAESLIAYPDPFVQGFGLFLRSVLQATGGMPTGSVADAELAYRRFEQAGDHWGMAMSAQVVGHSAGSGGGDRAIEWLERSVRHMELVGAKQDARSIGVLLHVRRALNGDPDAERRLRELAASVPDGEAGADFDGDVVQAYLGLAHLAWQRGRYEEALRYGDALDRIAPLAERLPRRRVAFRVEVAVLHLWVGEALPSARARASARAVESLAIVRDEALATNESPPLGAWALGGAELAAFRGDRESARELWALGIAAGADAGIVFPYGEGARLAAILGDQEQRRELLAAGPGRQAAAISARVRELMGGLLAKP
ncbi:BTAD domain-containing putative transcriptional regulator [Actinoplanes sp. NPDC026623]|uniref:BTAD domain-containing putative transcriptional regulator n=1 Tax=Actinoplanes sp. NPDC026623 TaxID=3155610 RepID=UPI0033FE242F